MSKKILCALLLSLGMSMLPSVTVNAKSEFSNISIDNNIDNNYRATKSSKNTENVLPEPIATSTNVIEDKVNSILTDRINMCKVNDKVSDTVDSISSTADLLIAEKKQKDEEIAKKKEEEKRAKEAAEKAVKEAEEKRKAELEKVQSDEAYLLAAIIHCEARGESFTGQVAVGAVVLNRVRSNDFPNTIKDVIYQKGQFSPVANGALNRVLLNGKVNQSCIEAAHTALNGENPIGDCLYFRTVNGRSGQIIGNHVFY